MRAEARLDDVHPALAYATAAVPIVGTVLLGLVYLVNRPAYYALLREDHAVEWAQFALLLGACLFALVASRRAWNRSIPAAVLLAAVALGALALAGEEISWGQRVFALGTPEQLAAANLQAELNVHNVEVAGLRLQSVFKLVSFVLAVAGLVLAWATRRPRPRLRGGTWRVLTVPTYTVVGSATMIAFWAVVVVAPINPVVRYQEWAEMGLYLAMAATIYAIWRRLRQEARAVDGRTARDRWSRVIPLVVVVVTVAFAALTIHHGIVPVNARHG